MGTSPPHLPLPLSSAPCPSPCHVLGHSFVHPRWLPGPLLSCQAGEARLPARCGSRDTQHSPQKAERETSGSGQGMEVVMCGHGARGAKHHVRKLVPSSAGGQHSSSVPHTPWCSCTDPSRARRCSHPTLWHRSQGVPMAGTRPRPQPRGPAGCGGCSVPTLAAGPRRGADRAGLIPAPPGNESGPVSVRARAGSKGVRKPPRQPFPCPSKRPPRALLVSLPCIRCSGQDQSRWVLARERHRPHAARGVLRWGCSAPLWMFCTVLLQHFGGAGGKSQTQAQRPHQHHQRGDEP